jgi:hypothetical protein
VESLPTETIVVSGGAKGVDQWAEEAARLHGLEVVVFRADWKRLGSKAGPLRNKEIVDSVSEVIDFWDMASRGTLNTVVLAVEAGRAVTIFDPEGNEVALQRALAAAEESGVVAGIRRARSQSAAS